MNIYLLAGAILLGLLRPDPAAQKPTPAPPKEWCVHFWHVPELGGALVLGLVRDDPPHRKPTPEKPVGMSLFVWRHETGYWYIVGPSGQSEDARPTMQVFDVGIVAAAGGNPFWAQGLWDAELVREVPLDDLIEKSRREAQMAREPLPCFPGEWSLMDGF